MLPGAQRGETKTEGDDGGYVRLLWQWSHTVLFSPTPALESLLTLVVDVVVAAAAAAVAAPGAVPEVVRLRVHAVGRGHDLDQVAARDLDRGDLGRGQPDEVGEDAADDGGVPDDEQVLLLALELDQRRFQAHCSQACSSVPFPRAGKKGERKK